jgi:hypothetical protein
LTATASLSEATIKTWFIVKRLFDVATSNNDTTVAPGTQDENKAADTAKVAIDGDSVVDVQSKEQVS